MLQLSTWRGAWLFRRLSGSSTVVFLTAALAMSASLAQTPPPLANPNLQFLSAGGISQTNGMLLQADGKIVIASGFSDVFARIGGVTGNRYLARLNADGSLDTSFNVDTNGPAIVFSGGNYIYVAGTYTTIGGVARNGLARVSVASGQVDAAWNPAPVDPNAITTLAADASDNVYVIGTAMSIGGLSNVRVAKLDPVTGAGVAGWGSTIPGNLSLAQVAVYQSTVYLVCGVNAVTQANRILKLSAAGVIDSAFAPDLNAIDIQVRAVTVGPNGDLYIASANPPLTNSTPPPSGSTYSAPVKFLRLLAANGAVAAGWSPPATPGIFSMVASADSIYAIHGTAVGDSGSRWGAMRYDLLTGQPNSGWATQLYETYGGSIVGGIAQNGTDLYIGGHFAYYGNQRRAGIAKLSVTDGSVLPFSPDLRANRVSFAPVASQLGDGSSILVGDFAEVNGLAVEGLIHLLADGSLDTGWRAPVFKGSINSARAMGGYLYLSGIFDLVDSTARPGFARLNITDGTLDTGFQPPSLDGSVSYFATDGADVFIMGAFRNVGGNPRFCVAKLNGITGAFVPQWAPVINNPSNLVSANCPGFQRIEAAAEYVYLAPASNTMTLSVGTFLRRVARVSTVNGQTDTSWDPNFNNGGVVRLHAFNGWLYTYGPFTTVFGSFNTQNVARFDVSNGSPDFGFSNSTTEFNGVSGFSYGNITAGTGGVFVSYTRSISGPTTTFQKRVRRLSISNGAVDNAYAPMVGADTTSTGVFVHTLSPSTVIVYGGINNVAGQPRQAVAYVSTNASTTAALPLPNINPLRNAAIRGLAVQPDGKLLVAGDFTSVDGVARQGAVRLNANGSLDAAFSVDFDVPPDNAKAIGNFIYVQGRFTHVSGVPRAGLARINISTGAVDTSWDPSPRPFGAIGNIDADASGNLYVFGENMSIGGISGVQVARILPSGLADTNFRGIPNISPNQLAVAANGAIYVGGLIFPPQPTQNYRIYKLNSTTGAVDSTWAPSLQAIDMDIKDMAVSATGDVYIAGQFSGNEVVQSGVTYTATRNFLKLSAANGSVPSQWNPPLANAQFHVALDNLGSVYTTRGIFYSDATSALITKYDANTGAIDPAFAPAEALGGNGDQGMVVLPDGILVGGAISSIGSVKTGPIAKLNATTGAVLSNFSTNMLTPGYLSFAHQLTNGKIMIGGFFSSVNGFAINNLARLNSDGSVDTTWTAGVPGFVASIRELGGSLYLSGFQPTATPAQIEFFTKLDLATGARDPAFNLPLDGQVRGAVLDSNTNSLYLIGGFSRVNSVNRPCVAKVNAATGALDSAWNPPIANANGLGLTCGRAIALNNGYVYLGFFSQTLAGGSPRLLVNNQPRFLGRVSPVTGVPDPNWDPNPNGQVTSLRDTGTQIYFAGGFNSIGGLSSTRIARINPATGIFDTTYTNLLSGLPGGAANMRVQSGNVFISGIGAGSGSNKDSNTAKPFVWKLLPNAQIDTAWIPDFSESDSDNDFTMSLSDYSTDKILVGGAFDRVNGQKRIALAAFSVATQQTLALTIRGRGTVTMQSSGALAASACADCTAGTYPFSFDSGATVTLTGVSTATSQFVGWSGGTGAASCTGTGACVVSLTSASSINAVFRQVRGFSEQ